MSTVLVALAEGIEEIEAITVIDVLRRADIDVTVVSMGNTQVRGAHNIRIVADRFIGDCCNRTYDMIVLPGGSAGAEYLRDSSYLTEMLKKQAEEGRYYAAICASPVVVLKKHGLLKGKKATAHPSVASKLTDKASAKERVVVDGNCITSQGPGTAIEFALALVELLTNAKTKQKISDAVLAK